LQRITIGKLFFQSTVDVQKQFIGFQRGKASTTITKCPSNHSDEEKKKKNLRQRRKNGRKKGKNYVLITKR